MQNITVDSILERLKKVGIVERLEQIHFLAQTEHESGGFTKFSENLNYRYKTARLVFPKYATMITEKQKELKKADTDFVDPVWFANLVYGQRLGNQDNGTNDNDGYDYRGSGAMQLTGKDNHRAFLSHASKQGLKLNGATLTIDNIDDYARTPEGAIESAIFFWKNNPKLKEFALKDDTTSVSKIINGGTNGLEERIKLVTKYKNLIK